VVKPKSKTCVIKLISESVGWRLPKVLSHLVGKRNNVISAKPLRV